MEEPKQYLDFIDYDVYSDGRIYSHKTNKFLKTYIGTNGYYNLSLQKNDKTYKLTLHRVLATCYVPNPNNYPCINHIDGNRLNNNLYNLEWCTHQQNMKAWVELGVPNSGLFKKGQIPWNKGIKCPNQSGENHHNAHKVNQYDLQGNFIRSFDTLEQARIFIGKNGSSGISQCCSGKLPNIYGYIWRYAEK